MGRAAYQPNSSADVQSNTTLPIGERLFLAVLLHEENITSLEEFGKNLINRLFADKYVSSLIEITNHIFKSLALTPVNWTNSSWTQAVVGLNHRLHRAANGKIYSIRHDLSEYRKLQLSLDALFAEAHIENNSIVFLFVTNEYGKSFLSFG